MDKWFSSPLFVVKTSWFGILDLCNREEEWMGHGVDVHEVRDGNDVQVGFRLVGVPLRDIKSSLSKGVC